MDFVLKTCSRTILAMQKRLYSTMAACFFTKKHKQTIAFWGFLYYITLNW